jgi:hypothetical protein
METSNNKVEIVIHVDDTLGETRRGDLTAALEARDGIYAAEFCPLRYHLMLVDYDSEKFSSQDILQLVGRENVTAQLIGPM